MNAVVRPSSFILLVLAFSILSAAQKQAPPAPPQTPRQALIEMVSGGSNALLKHLTVEVQQLLQQPELQEARLALSAAGSLKDEIGKNVQVFDTGETLLSMDQPSDHTKVEVHVNNDDLSGDSDTMELSVHFFIDGKEVRQEWQSFLSHFTVNMVRQQEVWRLNKIGVGAEFAIGDPEFLKAMYLKPATGVNMVGGRIGPGVHTELRAGEPSHVVDVQPQQVVALLGYAEQTFARQHADEGFTCSIAELSEAGKQFGLDPQVNTGLYKGYKISLTGCQGKPAGSFQISAEPAGKAGKAYCTDATQNLRVSDDGRAATCLSAGRSEPAAEEEGVGLDPSSATAPVKPKEQ